jgi:hypothetical protein
MPEREGQRDREEYLGRGAASPGARRGARTRFSVAKSWTQLMGEMGKGMWVVPRERHHESEREREKSQEKSRTRRWEVRWFHEANPDSGLRVEELGGKDDLIKVAEARVDPCHLRVEPSVTRGVRRGVGWAVVLAVRTVQWCGAQRLQLLR